MVQKNQPRTGSVLVIGRDHTGALDEAFESQFVGFERLHELDEGVVNDVFRVLPDPQDAERSPAERNGK